MPIALKEPGDLVAHRIENVTAVYISRIDIDLGPASPVLTMSVEAEVVLDPGDPGHPDADPPVPATPPRTERQALPAVVYSADALKALMADVTARTLEAKNVYAGIKAACYADLALRYPGTIH